MLQELVRKSEKMGRKFYLYFIFLKKNFMAKLHNKVNYWKWSTVILSFGVVFLLIFDVDVKPRFSFGSEKSEKKETIPVQVSTSSEALEKKANIEVAIDEDEILAPEGVILPVKFRDLGKKLIKEGVIDEKLLAAVYAERGGIPEAEKKLFYSEDNKDIVMNADNAGILLNLLWAFGLGNKNPILDEGKMQDPKYGGAGGFASTGGWTLAQGDPMNHFSKHEFVTLTKSQQEKVDRIAKNIYRPCCNNDTAFPDCNHGMAMLGLLELLAAQDLPEDEIYRLALKVNSYWFPDTYVNLAKFWKQQGKSWNELDPAELLGAQYSSAAGYRAVLSKVTPVNSSKSGGGCSV